MVASALVLTSCVKINTRTEYAEVFVEEQTSVHPVAGSVEYQPTASIHGTTLTVVLRQQERCKTTKTPVYRKTAHHAREPEGNSLFRPLYVALYGAGAIALGGALYLAPEENSNTASDSGQATDNRSAGLAIGAVGVGLLALAGIDQFRLRDTDQDLGLVEHDATVSEASCRDHAVANRKVQLSGGADVNWHVSGTTDENGRIQFALADIPEVVLANTPLGLALHIDRTSVPLALPDSAAAELLVALSNDQSSRVVRDRHAKATATCDASVSAAREQQREVKSSPDKVVDVWNSAKATCASMWNDVRERELVQAGVLAHDAQLERDGRDFDAAITAVIAKDKVVVAEWQRAEKLLATLGSLAPPDPKLNERTKKAEATRRRALDALVVQARRQVARDELEAATSTLGDAELVSNADPRIEPLRRQVSAREAALTKRAEEQRRREEAKAEREAERREGPMWHVEYICNGSVVAETWKRGFSARDVQRKLCMNLSSDVARLECMGGPNNPYCKFVATKVK